VRVAERLAERPTYDGPPIARPQRTGTSRIEQRAVERVRALVACMPASLVVQLALWPYELARWARAERIAESVVYNLLAARKPYLRMRERLAAQLGVQTGYLAALVDGVPAELAAPGGASDASGGRRARDGDNPLERRAVEVVAREIAAMPAATVVGLAIWPETLTEWARARGAQPSAVWATLAGAPSEMVVTALARRLDVAARELMALIEAERRPAGGPPVAAIAPRADEPPPPAVESPPAPAPPPAPRGTVTRAGGAPAAGQLSLGL
jgi:hypothetical protein